jgi:prolyl 4-hydroxylase
MTFMHESVAPEVREVLPGRVRCIYGLLSPGRCRELVDLAEGIGFGDAPITVGHGFVMAPEIRNNTRVMIDDVARATELWRLLEPFVASRIGTLTAVGLNERFRFYRYSPGEYFRWHRDGAFARNASERSLSTVMLYLNGDFRGGTTDFDLGEDPIRVVPEPGMALIFDHGLRHQGAPVLEGVKYVLRTDAMYRREA